MGQLVFLPEWRSFHLPFRFAASSGLDARDLRISGKKNALFSLFLAHFHAFGKAGKGQRRSWVSPKVQVRLQAMEKDFPWPALAR